MKKEIKNITIIIISFNLPGLTDELVEQVKRNIKFSHKLLVFDNGSEKGKISKYTTHRVEKNIGLSRGIDYIYNIAKTNKNVDAYWFLCNDIVLDKNVDYLEELVRFYNELSKKYKIACITPSVYPSEEYPISSQMKRQSNSRFRPIVYWEWDAALLIRDFMDKFYPNGFNLGTYHAGVNVELSYQAWKNGYGCFVLDNISFKEIMNQTFIQCGGKEVNGVFVPAIKDLSNILMKDLNILWNSYRKQGINFVKEREKMHRDIDLKGKFEKYLIKRKRNIFEKIKDISENLIFNLVYSCKEIFRRTRAILRKI